MKTLGMFLIVFLSLMSYVVLATVFGIDTHPLIQVVLALVGLGGLIYFTVKEFKWGRLVATVLATLLISGFSWWVFAYSEYESTELKVTGSEMASPLASVKLVDHANQPVSMAQILAEGPTLLVFYRGHW